MNVQEPRSAELPPPTQARAQAVVKHAAPLHYQLRIVRRWIEEGNRIVEVMGIRWPMKEHRLGNVASHLVIYMKSIEEIGKLRMGRKFPRIQDMTGTIAGGARAKL